MKVIGKPIFGIPKRRWKMVLRLLLRQEVLGRINRLLSFDMTLIAWKRGV
jgi:hypothetical protein